MEDIKIKDVQLEPMPTSKYINPVRMTFIQNGEKRYWDFKIGYQSVQCLLFNTSRQVLLFVKQFRPAVYANAGMKTRSDTSLQEVDWSKVPGSSGLTIELCAGIVDVNMSYKEVAKKEVLEECGLDIPLDNFQKLITYQSGIGGSGEQSTVFFAEFTDEMKVSQGGGLPEEGEFIEMVEMTIPQVREFLAQDTVPSPGGLLYALMWFLTNKVPSC